METTQDNNHSDASQKELRASEWWYKYGASRPDTALRSAVLTVAQAQVQVKNHVRSIFDSWRKLNRIISTREAVIQKRWIKKTREQRKKILLTGCPGMPSMHRPDFHEMLRRCASRDKSTKSWDGESVLRHPAINMEDLLQAKSLPLLLNSRCRHLPHVFAYTDLYSCRLDLVTNAIRLPFLPRGFTMLLAGQETEENYGMIQPNDSSLDSLNFCGGRGLLVLQTQEKLLKFLLECCYQILHDIQHDALLNPSVPIQAEPKAMTSTETSYFQLSAVMAESPYRVPKELDVTRLLKLIQARTAQAADHTTPISSPIHVRRNPPYQTTLISGATLTASTGFGHLDHTKPLPKDLEDALLTYSRSGQELPSVQDISGSSGLEDLDASSGDLFKLIFGLLCNTDNHDFLAHVGGWSFIAVIQHMLDQKPLLKKKLSAYILGIFSDISLSLQIFKEIMDFFPWSASFHDMLEKKEYRWQTCHMSGTPWWTAMYNCLKSSQTSTGQPRLMLPLTKTFYYPTDKTYNQANVNALRRAERYLDDLWEGIDGAYYGDGHTMHVYFASPAGDTREIRRTGPWIPPASSLPEPHSQPSGGDEARSSDIRFAEEKLTRFQLSETPRTKGRLVARRIHCALLTRTSPLPQKLRS
ncbi:hypothetical protein LTS07_004459 [Exophiala sideris]|nr:hypothetical protein LTS07_004459 [Exophiala sideris]KAK5040767.1 hypothetical protein LTR13_003068 [Exophiala sideris]KAK5184597.1 hypothetical protein LTR44_003272 [Eurotiomycetes sp. CCFEE 6388]